MMFKQSAERWFRAMTQPTLSAVQDAGTVASGSQQARGADLERELLTDPCHLLRRACQIADYGTTTDTLRKPEASGA